MKLAYFGFPHLGGTHSVYRTLREGLVERGVTVRWLGVGSSASDAFSDPFWSDERVNGTVVAGDVEDPRQQAQALIDHVSEEEYDGVIVNVLANPVQTNLTRYLPTEILRVMIVHSITPGTYRAARSIRDHVHAAVAVSPRIRSDLVNRLGFREDQAYMIPNALPFEPGTVPNRRPRGGELRVLSLGRVEDAAKGVFWLPRILEQAGPNVRLTITGDGPDLRELKRRFTGSLGQRTNFLGFVAPEDVPELLSQHDVLLLPSRYEGFGITLVEAMAAGCVPVASRISGVTDFVVDDGNTGLLFPVGDTAAAANALKELAGKGNLLNDMAERGIREANSRFSLGRTARSYSKLLKAVMQAPPTIEPVLNIDNWAMPRGLRPGLTTYLPLPLKNFLRTLRERLLWRTTGTSSSQPWAGQRNV